MAVRFSQSQGVIPGLLSDLGKYTHRKGLEIESIAKTSMKGGGSPHVPSRPGEPPHVDTGRLRASISTITNVGLRQVVTRVGTNVRSGRELELGTLSIKPRPWLRPAFNKVVRS